MNVLLTGATGYLGGHVARALAARGHGVHALTRGRAAGDSSLLPWVWHAYDGSTDAVERAMGAARPDAVIHLAASSRAGSAPGDVLPIVEPAVVLGAQLLASAAATGVKRCVFAGSYWEFGEAGSAGPNTLYAASKAASRAFLDHYVATHAIDGAALALFDVYGPNDPRPKLLPRLIRALATGEVVPLSPGDQRLDLIHVHDAAQAFVLAAESATALSDLKIAAPGAPVFGVGTGRTLSLREFVDLLQNIAGVRLNVEMGATPYPPHQIMNPIRSLPSLPGWRPEIPLETGLADLMRSGTGSC